MKILQLLFAVRLTGDLIINRKRHNSIHSSLQKILPLVRSQRNHRSPPSIAPHLASLPPSIPPNQAQALRLPSLLVALLHSI